MRIAEVDVAPDDRKSVVMAPVLDTGNIPEIEMLRPQFQAQRFLGRLRGIADSRDERKARR